VLSTNAQMPTANSVMPRTTVLPVLWDGNLKLVLVLRSTAELTANCAWILATAPYAKLD